MQSNPISVMNGYDRHFQKETLIVRVFLLLRVLTAFLDLLQVMVLVDMGLRSFYLHGTAVSGSHIATALMTSCADVIRQWFRALITELKVTLL